MVFASTTNIKLGPCFADICVTYNNCSPKFRIISGFLGFVRSDKTLGNGQHGRNGKDFVGTVVFAGGDQHLGQLRVEGELGHDGAQLGQVTVVVQSSQVVEKSAKSKNS